MRVLEKFLRLMKKELDIVFEKRFQLIMDTISY